MKYISKYVLLVLLVDIVDEGMLARVLQQVYVEVILSRGYRNLSLQGIYKSYPQDDREVILVRGY